MGPNIIHIMFLKKNFVTKSELFQRGENLIFRKKNPSRDHFVINIANVVVCSPIFLSTNVGSISRLALDWERSIFQKIVNY